MTEEKDPKAWTSFYTDAQAKIKAAIKAREDAAIRKTMASKEKLFKLQDAVARGIKSEQLLASDFWRDDVEPFLRSEAVLKPWSPKEDGYFSFLRLVVQYIIGSGQVRVLTKLLSKLAQWQTEGQEAEKILKAENEKKRIVESRI